MTEPKYTSTLEQLIQYAKSLGETPNVPFTAERYMITIIDLVEGEFSIEGYPISSKCNLQGIMGDDLDLSGVKSDLLDYISAKKSSSFLDDLYMKKCLAAAQSKAKENGVNEITPELLLMCIMENPSEAIKGCLQHRKDSNEENGNADPVLEMRKAFETFFNSFPIEKIFKAFEHQYPDYEEHDGETGVPADIMNVVERMTELFEKYGEEEGLKYFESKLDSILKEQQEELAALKKQEDETSLDGEEEQKDQAALERKFDELLDVLLGEDDDKVPVKSEEKKMSNNTKEQIAQLTEKTKGIRQSLMDTVLGQDKAISVFTSGYFQSELLSITDKARVRPATFLFAGPPGVGKTFLAESAAKVLDLPFARFDMSEYCDKEASLEFCGSDKVYKNGKAGNFTSFVSKNKKCVVLFDEIEKAHLSIIHLFLQILDAGRIRDNFTDEEISLKETILIFTTNAGKPFYENADQGDFSSVSRKVILKALENDVNPETGSPYFPAAICSRFASGNVVMFNNISAHNLRDIAKREILRHAENFEREIGIEIDIDEKVYSALLYAEGGAADARTIRSRAEAFFDDELYELFRLIGMKDENSILSLERINIGLNFSSCTSDVRELFENSCKPEVLLFTSKKIATRYKKAGAKCVLYSTDNTDEASDYIKNHDISAILIDMNCESDLCDYEYLNVEDVESVSRDFLWLCHEFYSDIPIYILEDSTHLYNQEERVSFSRQGIRGVLNIEDKNKFAIELETICDNISQQNNMNLLAKSNRLVTYETAQRVMPDGKTVEIQLFDFELVKAVDAEDSKNIISNVSKPNVRFDQVIGADDAKQELKYFVEYLKNPKKYRGTGVRAPKGVLLYGPPGTGKTMLAKAMASESDVTFITAEGNQFLKQYVGEGPEKVHELFRTARKYSPSILFIDEIDAIAKERTGREASDTEAILTAFLTEMDGFKNDLSKPVFVLAATNYDVEPGTGKSLDPALMRRFDRRVYIDLPNRDDRIRYMKMKLSENSSYAISDQKIENLAMRSTGMSLAELESVFELSLRSAIREGNMRVTDAVIDEAFETFNNGEKKDWDISQLERVARHESGHTFLCWVSGETPSYVTVAARGSHGGYMQHADNEGKAIYTKEELLAKIRTSLGGRAAEIVYYGSQDGVSTGASGDLISATRMAEQLICAYGMDDSIGLGVIAQDMIQSGPLALEIRKAVNKILNEELQKAIQMISENRHSVDRMVKKLIEKTHLAEGDIQEVFITKKR